MLKYSDSQIAEIKRHFNDVITYYKVRRHLKACFSLQQRLKNESAKKYLMEGVYLRIDLMLRCVEAVFTLFPPSHQHKLSHSARNDVLINLHAFFINMSGTLDNMAWVFAYEKELYCDNAKCALTKYDVSLFKAKFQEHLPSSFREYLNDKQICDWDKTYNRDFRDALAHRIPFRIPSAQFTTDEEDEYRKITNDLQRIADVSVHSSAVCAATNIENALELMTGQNSLGEALPAIVLEESKACPFIPFHAQIINDTRMVCGVCEEFAKLF